MNSENIDFKNINSDFILHFKKLAQHMQELVLRDAFKLSKFEDIKKLWNNTKQSKELKQNLCLYILQNETQKDTKLLNLIFDDSEKAKITTNFHLLFDVQNNPDVYAFACKNFHIENKDILLIVSNVIKNDNKNAIIWLLNNYLDKDINLSEILLQTIKINFKEKKHTELIVNHLESLNKEDSQFINYLLEKLFEKLSTPKKKKNPLDFLAKSDIEYLTYLENILIISRKNILDKILETKPKIKQKVNKI